MMTQALYAYAVLPADASLPEAAPILPGAPMTLLRAGGCAALVSSVHRPAFEEGARDADWMAERVRAHHAAVAAAASAGPALPLAFGALFAGPAPVAAWLAARGRRLRAALTNVANCTEWNLRLEEDVEGHVSWLDRHDEALRDLAERAGDAGRGAAFLLGRSRARRLTEIRMERRAALCRDLAERLARHARALPAAMTALVPQDRVGAMRADIEGLARDLDGTGLRLTLAGPWPAYAYAREALRDAR